MTAVCPPCKEDAHGKCVGSWTTENHRKGSRMRRVSVPRSRHACKCVCHLPADWRGDPTEVPRLPSIFLPAEFNMGENRERPKLRGLRVA